ncbi:MAG: hypothetical protein P8P74_04750 [Crocinitomicaceae bacterium]|nr:hypothetical protein [Crocinitomicaceae bacterium]
MNTQLDDVMFINLVDLNGKSVMTRMLGNTDTGDNLQKIQLPADLNNDLYVVHLFVGNTSTSSTMRILSK